MPWEWRDIPIWHYELMRTTLSVKNDMTKYRAATASIEPFGGEKEACHSQATRPGYQGMLPLKTAHAWRESTTFYP